MARSTRSTRQPAPPADPGNTPPAGDPEDLTPPPPPPAPPADTLTLPPPEAPPDPTGNGDTPPATGVSDEERQRIREEARREAEEALNTRLQSVDAELAELRRERETRLEAERAEEQRQAEEARRAEEEDLSARELLERERQTWAQERAQINQRFEDMDAARQRDAAILEQERRLNAIREYRDRRVAEEADDIMPQLRDMVSGNTEEEVEASIVVLKERSASILDSVAQAQGQPRVPGSRVTHPPVGPMDQQAGQETLTAQDIANMDLNQYSQVRDRLLGAVSRRVSESGPYGR